MTSGTRVRHEVHADGPWSDTLLWYARAVEQMQARPLTDPTSWEYLAAVHGRDPEGQDAEFWDQCQHQTWYFLPWHRGYLFWFEQIVQAAIDEIGGGPGDWALPYWNYSLADSEARVLPQAFRDKKTPDGKENRLRVRRNPGVNEGEEIFPSWDVDVSALDLPRFEADDFGAAQASAGRPLALATRAPASASSRQCPTGRCMSISAGSCPIQQRRRAIQSFGYTTRTSIACGRSGDRTILTPSRPLRSGSTSTSSCTTPKAM